MAGTYNDDYSRVRSRIGGVTKAPALPTRHRSACPLVLGRLKISWFFATQRMLLSVWYLFLNDRSLLLSFFPS